MQCSAVQCSVVQCSTGRQAGIRTSIRAGHIVLHVHTLHIPYTTSIENSTIYLATVAPATPFSPFSLIKGYELPSCKYMGRRGSSSRPYCACGSF